MMTMNDWLRRTRSEDEEEAFPTFGFGTTSAAATAQSPSYSMNPSSTGEDSAAQGTRTTLEARPWGTRTILEARPWGTRTTLEAEPWGTRTTLEAEPWGTRTTSQNPGTWGSPQSAERELAPETDALDWMSRTTDEVDRATQNAINRYNSPGNQQMLDNMTNRSRSADNFQDSRNRSNAQFSQALATQGQRQTASLQSSMTREQMGWAQDVALGGQPGDGRKRGSRSVSIEYSYSPFNTFMNNSAIIGNLGGFYSTQSNERIQNRQLGLQAQGMGLDDRYRNNQLELQAQSMEMNERIQNRQLGLQAQGMGLDDRYRNRALAVDTLIKANQRSLWSSPLEQIALNQARQPGMAR